MRTAEAGSPVICTMAFDSPLAAAYKRRCMNRQTASIACGASLPG